MKAPGSLQLDKRVRFEAREPAAAFAAETFAPFRTLWARLRDVSPGRDERLSGDGAIGARRTRAWIRRRGDIDASMRVVHGARIMRIVGGPAEVFDGRYLELMLEDWTTQGAAA